MLGVMESGTQKAGRIAVATAVAAGMVFFGFVMSYGGYRTVRQWSSIGVAYALCGLIWTLAGPAMIVAGLWVLGSLGRHRFPLWIGGAAAVLSGAVLVTGVLAHVIPCSGPS
jgi:hypothetical protein